MSYKLTFPEGTIVSVDNRPDNFTGIATCDNGTLLYYVNGRLHRDGGLPSYIAGRYIGYTLNGKTTGQLHT